MNCKYCGMEHHSSRVLNLCYSYQSSLKQIAEQQDRIIYLESPLKEIEEHEHIKSGLCAPLGEGRIFQGRRQGHRCAAEIAKRWREK